MHSVSDADWVRQLRELLSSAGEELPSELVAEYDCSGLHSALRGVLLSKRGVRADGHVQVCEECDGSLTKRPVPKFAIKNDFAVGAFPSRFADITLP